MVIAHAVIQILRRLNADPDAVGSLWEPETVGPPPLAGPGSSSNHGIAASSPPAGMGREIRRTAAHFPQRYVFPDGELVPVEDAIEVARQGGFEVLDVQSLRPHYVLTLAAWVARLEANWADARAAAGEEVART